MKILTLFGSKEVVISDEEAVKLYEAIEKGAEGLLLLSNGDTINPKGIASITSIPKKQFYNKQPLINGEYINGAYGRYYLEPEDRKDIKTCYDPKYFDLQLVEAKEDKKLPEVSKFAKKVKIKGMSGSKFNQNPNVLLNKNNNYGNRKRNFKHFR